MKEKNKKIMEKISQSKVFIIAFSFFIVFLLVIMPIAVHASDIVQNAMSAGYGLVIDLIAAIIKLFGSLLVQVMFLVVWLSQFNSYIDNPYVNEGWVVLRDLVNMFFVLGLLFIAFVTVLKIEKQPWNKMLGRLLVMAILVNFSKTICGIIIDFFQVLMITFVNAYKDITAGNIENALKMTSWFKQGNSGADPKIADVAGALLGLIYTIVTFIVICIFCVILTIRMIALWILIVFSPVAFFAWSVTGISGKIGEFANMWWNQFFNYCIVGPFIAFFLWLSLVTMVKLNYNEMVNGYTEADRATHAPKEFGDNNIDNLIAILIGIVMLVAGLQMSARFAGAGASLATSGANFIKNQTAGRLERAATSVGRTGAAIATAPVRAAGAVAAAPFRAAGAYLGGRVKGAKESVERGRFTRLLTKAGREQAVEAARARGEAAGIPFKGGAGELATRDMRAKQAQDYKKIRKDINWENPEQIRQLQNKSLKRGIDPKTGKEVLKPLNKDLRFWESTYTALADAGKLSYKDVDDMEKLGLFSEKNGMKGRGKQVFLEDMEKRYEKKTHIKKAFSSLIYNAETNEYEDVNGLEERGNQATAQAQASGYNLNAANFSKFAKRQKDGTFTLDTQDAEFQKLDTGTQNHIRSLYNDYQGELAAGGGVQTTANKKDFYAIARLSDIREKKYGEIRKAIATAPEGDLNEAGKIANMGDIIQNPVDYAVAEVDGFTDQIPRIGKLDQIARDNINVKARFLMSTGQERVALIAANKNLFDKDLHDKSAAELGDDKNLSLPEIKKLDQIRSNMSDDKLKKFQDLIVESSSQFNAMGQKLTGGEGQRSQSLDNIIGSRAASIGGGIEDEIRTFATKRPRRTPRGFTYEANSIDEEAASLLNVTKNEPTKDARKKKIALRIQQISSLDAAESEGMAEYLIDNEVKITSRAEAGKKVKTDSVPKIQAVIRVIQDEYKDGTKDAGRVNHLVDIFISQIRNQIKTGGLLEKDIRPDELEKALRSLAGDLLTAKDEKELNKKINAFKNSMKSRGINLQEQQKKKGTP